MRSRFLGILLTRIDTRSRSASWGGTPDRSRCLNLGAESHSETAGKIVHLRRNLQP